MKHPSLILVTALLACVLLGCGGAPRVAESPRQAPSPTQPEPAPVKEAGVAKHPGETETPDSNDRPEHKPATPAEQPEKTPLFDVTLYPDKHIYPIDHSIGVRLMLRNNSSRPVTLDREINFLKGFEINDTRLGAAKYDRERKKLARPLVVPPGGFIGVWLDLGKHFPVLAKEPGNYRLRWYDPDLGESRPAEIDVTRYVLLITDYGDVAFKLMPNVAPETVARFRRLASQNFYDGSFVSGTKHKSMVVVSPSRENMRVFSGGFAPLKQETTTETITTGDVVVVRQLDVERLRRGLPERKEFLDAGTPSFFFQLRQLPPSRRMKYTVFGRVFRGLDVLNAISRCPRARGSQGQELSSPAREIRVRRVVLVEEGGAADRRPVLPPEDARPDAALGISPDLESFTYGEPLKLELTLRNSYDVPLTLPGEPGIKNGLKIFRLEKSKIGQTFETVRKPVEFDRNFPEKRLPIPDGRLAPGGMVGIRLDITDLCPAFAQGGRFEIVWEYAGVKTEPVSIRIEKSLFATIFTNKGSLEVMLYEGTAPLAVERFRQLAEEGFYDNLTFHRVIDTPSLALVQSGSPAADVTGRSEREPVPLEPSKRRFRVGTVGLARTPADPDSGNSQYFIVTKIRADGTAALYRRYTQIGQVRYARDAEGKPADFRDVLRKIEKNDKVIRIEISEKKPQRNDKEES